METYLQQKQRHQKEVDDFGGIFFAFNNKQFEEGMKSLGLEMSETNKLYSLGAGGYILKDRSEAFHAMFDRQNKERKALMKEEKNLIEALVYELQNHEYCITYDPSEALEALGLSENEVDKKILGEAISLAL